MKLFEDLPSTNRPITAEMLNQIQDNLVVVSSTEPTGDNREKVWIQKGKNIFNIDTMVEFIGKYRVWDTGWYIYENKGYNGIKFPVEPNKAYVFSTDATQQTSIVFWDKNFNYISGNTFEGTSFVTPDNCHTVTLCVKNDYTWIQVEQGTKATEPEEYIEPKIYVLNDNGVYESFVQSEVAISKTKPSNNEKVWMQKGKNLIDFKKMTNSSLNESNGTLQIDNTRLVTPYIFLLAGTYTISCNLSRFAYVIYNKDKTFKSFVTWNTFPNQIVIENDCYIKLEVIKDYNGSENVSITDISYLQLEQGSTATEYEEYVEPKIYVKNDNDVYEKFISKEDTLEKYSTEEQEIGTWIDGKPLYRKQVIINFTGNNGWQNFELGTTNVDFLTDEWDACVIPSSAYGHVKESIKSMGGRVQMLPSINAVALYAPFTDVATEYISILYTKTTD